MLLTTLQYTGQPPTTKSLSVQNVSNVEKPCVKPLYTLSHWIMIFAEWCNEWLLGEGVGTEAQTDELICPRLPSWSKAKLGLIWSHPSQGLVLPLLAKEKGQKFSLTVCCDSPTTCHKKYTRRSQSSRLLWAVTNWSQCPAFVHAVPSAQNAISSPSPAGLILHSFNPLLRSYSMFLNKKDTNTVLPNL